MRSRKVIGVLCYGLAVCLLATNPALAGAPTTKVSDSPESLPPAISMLKNLKKNSTQRPVIDSSQTKKHVVVKQLQLHPEKKVTPAKNLVTKKHSIPQSKSFKLLPKPIEDKPQGVMGDQQDEEDHLSVAQTKIDPEDIQFDQSALVQRQEEMDKGIVEAKAREEVASIESAKYYAEHEHEIKVKEIADALAKRQPALQPEILEPAVNLNTQLADESATTTNVYPVKSVKISYRQKNKTMTGKVQTDLTGSKNKLVSMSDAAKSALKAREIARAAKREPVKPITRDEAKLDQSSDYSPLPEGAELVAGNPYNDEFFIVADDSPKELKQLAENAKNKDYLPPVVVAASEKQSNDHAVRALINKVTTRVANTAKYVSDPIIHYMTAQKIASVSKPKTFTPASEPLSKPQFAADKVTTKVFNSQLSKKKETEEVNNIINQLQASNTKTSSVQKVSIKAANKKHVKTVASKPVKKQVATNEKSLSKQEVVAQHVSKLAKAKVVKQEAFKPEVKSYAQTVQMKHYTKLKATARPRPKPQQAQLKPKPEPKPEPQLAQKKPTTMSHFVQNKPVTKSHFAKKQYKGHKTLIEQQLVQKAVKMRQTRTKKSDTKFIVKSHSSSMHAEATTKPQRSHKVLPEDEDVMNDAF